MSRVYTFFVLLISAILLLIFQRAELAQIWDTDLKSTGSYYRESFFQDQRKNPQQSLSELNGRRTQTASNQVRYRFAHKYQTQLYLQPELVKQNSLKDQNKKIRAYRNLTSIQVILPDGSQHKIFDVAQNRSQRIPLSPYLKEFPSFELLLETSEVQTADHVIGALEIMRLDNPVPTLNLSGLSLLLLIPLFVYIFGIYLLELSVPTSLALTTLSLLHLHILSIIRPQLAQDLGLASLFSILVALACTALLHKKTIPLSAFWWGICILALKLRWDEIQISALRPLKSLSEASTYQAHAIGMDLFTSRGFFSELFSHGPLYPFLLKLNGMLFGFSDLHLYYVPLGLSLILIILTWALARILLGGSWRALIVMFLLAINPFLIMQSTQVRPDLLGSCLALVYLILVFSRSRSAWRYGLLRGGVLMSILWVHLSLAPLVCILLGLDMVYQWRRQLSRKRILIAASCSGALILFALIPGLIQNWTHYGSYLPESTAYVSHVGNLEFSDRSGFPSSLDVMRNGTAANGYRHLSILEYFFDYHQWQELIFGVLLGLGMILLDSMGVLLQIAHGQNILDTLIYGLSSQQNMLPILLRFMLEIFTTLFLGVFVWKRYRRYRFLVLLLSCWMLPYAFFHGIFMIKGLSLFQSYLDQQILLLFTPVLTLMLVDMLSWAISNRQRWLI